MHLLQLRFLKRDRLNIIVKVEDSVHKVINVSTLVLLLLLLLFLLLQLMLFLPRSEVHCLRTRAHHAHDVGR